MVETFQVIIPSYKRLGSLQSTYEQLKDDPRLSLLFITHESDQESFELVRSLQKSWNKVGHVVDTQPPSGVNATNRGYWATYPGWVVIGQDDFRWHEGWLDAALKVRDETKAKVIGLNDGVDIRPGHSVAWLVDRSTSLCQSFPNVVFFPHYKKNFSDDELNEYAKSRGIWAHADKALVEHLHPSLGKSKDDETYQHLEPYFQQDFDLYNSRRHLWA